MRARGPAGGLFFYLYLLGLGRTTNGALRVLCETSGRGLLEPGCRRLGDLDGVFVVVVGDCRGDGARGRTAGTDDRDGGSICGMPCFHLRKGHRGSLQLMEFHGTQWHPVGSPLHLLSEFDNPVCFGLRHVYFWHTLLNKTKIATKPPLVNYIKNAVTEAFLYN